eukprot:scaffold103626_cov20-Prasinocladus_malaysianus.AAC.1
MTVFVQLFTSLPSEWICFNLKSQMRSKGRRDTVKQRAICSAQPSGRCQLLPCGHAHVISSFHWRVVRFSSIAK